MKPVCKLIVTVMLCCAIIGFQTCLMVGIWRCSTGSNNEDNSDGNHTKSRDPGLFLDIIRGIVLVVTSAMGHLQNGDRHGCFYIPIRIQNHIPINTKICPHHNITIQEKNNKIFVLKMPQLNEVISFLKDCIVGRVCWMRRGMLKSSSHCAREFYKH